MLEVVQLDDVEVTPAALVCVVYDEVALGLGDRGLGHKSIKLIQRMGGKVRKGWVDDHSRVGIMQCLPWQLRMVQPSECESWESKEEESRFENTPFSVVWSVVNGKQSCSALSRQSNSGWKGTPKPKQNSSLSPSSPVYMTGAIAYLRQFRSPQNQPTYLYFSFHESSFSLIEAQNFQRNLRSLMRFLGFL